MIKVPPTPDHRWDHWNEIGHVCLDECDRSVLTSPNREMWGSVTFPTSSSRGMCGSVTFLLLVTEKGVFKCNPCVFPVAKNVWKRHVITSKFISAGRYVIGCEVVTFVFLPAGGDVWCDSLVRGARRWLPRGSTGVYSVGRAPGPGPIPVPIANWRETVQQQVNRIWHQINTEAQRKR